jgi:hypothetical protein
MVRPGSEAIIKNTVCGWDITEGGKIILENYDASSAANGIFFYRGKIIAVNSRFNIISIPVRGSQKYTSELSNLNPGLIQRLLIEKNDGDDYLQLTNTIVNRWVVDAGDPVDPSFVDLVVKNSKLWGLWIWFCPGTDVGLSNIKPGIYPYWRMSDAWSLNGVDYDIELVNTTIEMFKLQTLGNARIENVSGVQVATRGSSFAYVKNSIIEASLILRGNEHVILENSEVQRGSVQLIEDRSDLQYVIGRGGVHYLEFRKAVIETPLEIASEYTRIKGEVTIHTRYAEVNWVFGIVEREFPVVILDSEGCPMENAQVEVISPEGNVICRKFTDQQGKALFNITFTKENYNKKWILNITADGMSISERVGFLTSTPILLTYFKPAEFIVTDLTIEPAEAQPMQKVKISVKVINVGEQSGTYVVYLFINGVMVDSQTVTLRGGESTTVNFSVTKEESGSYEVNVAGQRGTLVVKAVGISRGLYVSVALIVTAALVIIVLLRKASIGSLLAQE